MITKPKEHSRIDAYLAEVIGHLLRHAPVTLSITLVVHPANPASQGDAMILSNELYFTFVIDTLKKAKTVSHISEEMH